MKHHPVDRNTLLWIWQTFRNRLGSVSLLTLLHAVSSIILVKRALLMRNLVDSAAAGNRGGFFHYGFVIVAVTLAQITLSACSRYLSEATSSRLENDFKGRLFSTLLNRDYASVTAVHSGEWMNRITSDAVVVARGLTSLVPNLVGVAVRFAGALAMLLIIEPRLTYILLPGGVVLVVSSLFFRKILKKQHKQAQEANGRVRVFMQERLGSLLVIRAFGKEQASFDQNSENMTEHHKLRMRRNNFSNVCNTGLSLLMNGIYLLSALYCGYGMLRQRLSYGTFTAVLSLVNQVQRPLSSFTGFLPQYYATLASAERLMEAESYREDSQPPVIADADIGEFYARRFSALGLRNAVFRYHSVSPSGKESPVVLNGLNLQINKGEFVAFTGHSGCGKSTVIKLLMSLYALDDGERYLIYDGQSHDLTSAWRNLFAYVPQENRLMSGTIREVVAFNDRSAMDMEDRLWNALDIACAAEFVSALHDGLDSRLGENGAGLSEGQMQRIAVARALFSNRPILLLDESTSALDETTERRLLINLRSMTNRTVLIITHRPAILSICDREFHFSENGVSVRSC